MQMATKKQGKQDWTLNYWRYIVKDPAGKVIWQMVIFQTPPLPLNQQPQDLQQFLLVNQHQPTVEAANLFAGQWAKDAVGQTYTESHSGVLTCKWDENNDYWHPTYSRAL